MFTTEQHTALLTIRKVTQALIDVGCDYNDAIELGKAIARNQHEHIPFNPTQENLVVKWANEIVVAGLSFCVFPF